MTRRGFALLGALWFVALATVGVSVALEGSATFLGASINRANLIKAEWARNACWSVFRAKSGRGLQAVDSTVRARIGELRDTRVEFANGTACTVDVTDLGERLNVNVAPPEMLRCLFGYAGDSIVVKRPFPNDELMLRALEPLLDSAVRPLMTTRGTGQLNANVAASELLACLPGWDVPSARAVVAARTSGKSFGSLSEVTAVVPASSRNEILRRFAEAATYLAGYSPAYEVCVLGTAGPRSISAAMTAVLAPNARRGWHVLAQEVE